MEARYWKEEAGKVRCGLCPHHCLISDGAVGICGVRRNDSGKLTALSYGLVSSVHVDPMEKKPFYHMHPGEGVLSFGSLGCNLGCMHCQNYSISQARPGRDDTNRIAPEEVPSMVRRSACRGVAWTYNEPTMWHEFAADASKACKKEGMFSVFVSNGYIEETPLRDLKGLVDGMNIDVKGFTEDFYHKICKAKLAPVLNAVQVAHDIGMHVELTYLIIPGHNDDRGEIDRFCRWAAGVDAEMPVHFSRFHPDYKMMDVPMTPAKTMEMAHEVAKAAGLSFVYLGNMRSGAEDTICPQCGNVAIKRAYFDVVKMSLNGGRCGKCGRDLNIIM
ncbi:MAG: pyruvate formate lyase-activating enzyme 1 [Methanomassiliicoccales archaeon PtaU1.Bin124]|nr:MAG: pyruvate formate lyase-activating enzyme 1 [Methanomassiliicoccales archaeon PtaU1.Bin124]